ncbi:MAG: hypothetical protein IKG27_00285 [Bacilli bacterium]|nr:hypothetical protein [Bacilli bacterium]
MNKHIIHIDDKTYIFYLKNNVLTLCEYVNGKPKIIDPKEKSKDAKVAIAGLLDILKGKIEKKIKNNEYKSLDDIKKDIDKAMNGINFAEAQKLMSKINFENTKEYEETLKYLYDKFEKQNEEIELKKQMIEKNIDVNIKDIFEKHGISEYEVGNSKSVITYMKNGIPHTLSYTSLDTNIYEVILRSIEFDKMHSEEEIDSEIERVLDNASKFKYTKNENQEMSEIESSTEPVIPMEEIKEFLKREYNITDIKGIKPQDLGAINGAFLIDLGNGWEPIFVTREEGVLKVSFGKEKEIDSEGKVELKGRDNKHEKMAEEVNALAKEEQLKVIYLKLQNEEELTTEEKEVIDSYRDEQNFYQLSVEGQEMCKEIIEIIDSIEKEKNPELKNENVKKLGEWPKPKTNNDEGAFAYIGIVTFLSGLITGMFVYGFFKIFLIR